MLVWRLAERFGLVFTVQLGSSTVVVLRGSEAVKEALLQHKNEERRGEFAGFQAHGDKGTSHFSQGPRWVLGAWQGLEQQ